MLASYENWYQDVLSTRGGIRQLAIPVGTAHENPVILSYWDLARLKSEDPFRRRGWKIKISRPGNYKFELEFNKTEYPCQAVLQYQDIKRKTDLRPGSNSATFELYLEPSEEYVHAWIDIMDKLESVDYVNVTFLN